MTVLTEEVIEEVKKIGKAFIVVGIPSFRNAPTISHVITVVGQGLKRYFPQVTSVIVNADGGSEDNTRDIALKTPVPSGIGKIITPYNGLPGKGSAFHAIFEIADRLEARVCLVFDADLRSITPEWIWQFAKPVYQHSYGFVTPHYLRYKYDGTITNNLAYPLTSALYGLRIRQPIGGDFAFTGALAKIFSHHHVWQTDIAKFGIDIWMTTLAIVEGFQIAQAPVAVKLHDPKDPRTDLTLMFKQVASTLFDLMEVFKENWQATKKSRPADTFDHHPKVNKIKGVEISIDEHIDQAKEEFQNYLETFKKVLPYSIYSATKQAFNLPNQSFHLPAELWAKLTYNLAVAYHFSSNKKSDIINAFASLYLGRVASFAEETQYLSTQLVETLVEGYVDVFENLKPYLVKRWKESEKKGQQGRARKRRLAK